jgi:hypothetical protein
VLVTASQQMPGTSNMLMREDERLKHVTFTAYGSEKGVIGSLSTVAGLVAGIQAPAGQAA